MKKCKFCFTKSDDEFMVCPVCKIPFDKTKKDLTKEEKKIWMTARTLFIMASFVMWGGIFMLGNSILLIQINQIFLGE